MFTFVPNLEAAAADRRRALLEDAAQFRLARQVKKARDRRRALAADAVARRLARSVSRSL